jgi:RNA polymerase sigma-70 factor (ECF subfamily)
MSPSSPDPEVPPEGGGSDERGAAEGASDHDLVRAAQRGEEAGYAQLVKRHEERAVRVALSMVANREDARDLAQEGFLRVFRNIERFDFKHEFTTWLYRIVTNLAIDHLRKRRPAMSTSSADEGEADLDLVDPDEDTPSAEMERRETAEKVRACIDRLADHFRTVMVLRELEGLPCTEIAEIVGATHVTVRWRLHRGRKLFLAEWERMESQRAAGPDPFALSSPEDSNPPGNLP